MEEAEIECVATGPDRVTQHSRSPTREDDDELEWAGEREFTSPMRGREKHRSRSQFQHPRPSSSEETGREDGRIGDNQQDSALTNETGEETARSNSSSNTLSSSHTRSHSPPFPYSSYLSPRPLSISKVHSLISSQQTNLPSAPSAPPPRPPRPDSEDYTRLFEIIDLLLDDSVFMASIQLPPRAPGPNLEDYIRLLQSLDVVLDESVSTTPIQPLSAPPRSASEEYKSIVESIGVALDSSVIITSYQPPHRERSVSRGRRTLTWFERLTPQPNRRLTQKRFRSLSGGALCDRNGRVCTPEERGGGTGGWYQGEIDLDVNEEVDLADWHEGDLDKEEEETY